MLLAPKDAAVTSLVGLTPAEAQAAWERAVEKAGGRSVTARLVKQVVRGTGGAAPEIAGRCQKRLSKSDQRRLIDAAIGELLVLAGRTSIADLLTAKLEELHKQIQKTLP